MLLILFFILGIWFLPSKNFLVRARQPTSTKVVFVYRDKAMMYATYNLRKLNLNSNGPCMCQINFEVCYDWLVLLELTWSLELLNECERVIYTKNYPLEGDNFLAKRQPFFGVVPRKKKSQSPRKVPSAQQIPGRKQRNISNLTGRSGSRFCRKSIFAVCCSHIESNDYGVNENMSFSKD